MLNFREQFTVTVEPTSGEILSNYDNRATSLSCMINYLMVNGLSYHHRAAARGYMSRVATHVIAEPYKGRFGEGYIIREPRYDTNNYHYIHYYVK